MLDIFHDPQDGDPSLKIEACEAVLSPCRSNYFSLYFFEEGEIEFEQEMHRYTAHPPCLCCVNTYQTHHYQSKLPFRGRRIQFHANFLCLETYHAEVGCNGVLFNHTGVPAAVMIPADSLVQIRLHFDEIESELQQQLSGRHDALLSHLKLLLIHATRLKQEQQRSKWLPSGADENSIGPMSFEMHQLHALIEAHHHQHSDASFYASKLGISAHRLNRLLKEHYQTSLMAMLQDRKVKMCKWHLLHTDHPIKAIAHQHGFRDEFYFSRWFKKFTGLSPSRFRTFEWQIRGITKSP